MPNPRSAGVVMYRLRDGALEVLLLHPGGPYWQKKDDGAWSIAKGEFGDDETPADAARREFAEETGFALDGELQPLTPVRQRSGKVIHPYAIAGDVDAAALQSNTFALEWPPRSGTLREFPEMDRAAWFTLGEAQRKIIAGQRPILDELARLLGVTP